MSPSVMSTTSKQDYQTPLWFFKGVEKLFDFRFNLDAAASLSNSLCDHYYDLDEDGLKQAWRSWTWCNPPYHNIMPWAKKALEETYCYRHTKSVLLLPARVETRWYKLLHTTKGVSIFHITPRLNFIDPDTRLPLAGNPLTSTLFIVGTTHKKIGYLEAKENKDFKVEFSV